MRVRLVHLWKVLDNGFWFVPTVMWVAAALLALVLVWVDQRLGPGDAGMLTRVPMVGPTLAPASAEAARGLLATIGGTAITVCGIVFSIVIATLTQASSQFGPRLLGRFMSDTRNQVVLGTFVATFLYSLVVLLAVRPRPDGTDFVPRVALAGSLVLAVANLATLVYFIHHVARHLQAPHFIATIGDDLLRTVDAVYPCHVGAPVDRPAERERELLARLERDGYRAVHATRSGYVQAVDDTALVGALAAHDLVAEFYAQPGRFVFERQLVARVGPADRCTDAAARAVGEAMFLGTQRTNEQDPEFAIDQMVEIAIRALSPAINDPFTATNVLDRLAPALVRLAAQRFPTRVRADDAGVPRLVAHAPGFTHFCGAAFDLIRRNASGHVSVSARLIETVEAVLLSVPEMPDERRRVLLGHAELTHAAAMRHDPQPPDAALLDDRIMRARRAAQTDADDPPIAPAMAVA